MSCLSNCIMSERSMDVLYIRRSSEYAINVRVCSHSPLLLSAQSDSATPWWIDLAGCYSMFTLTFIPHLGMSRNYYAISGPVDNRQTYSLFYNYSTHPHAGCSSHEYFSDETDPCTGDHRREVSV